MWQYDKSREDYYMMNIFGKENNDMNRMIAMEVRIFFGMFNNSPAKSSSPENQWP